MHEFLAKLARFAVSKGAAFCYAVTVGVSGQLAYNYLQPKEPAPTVVAVPAAIVAPAPAAAPGPAPSPQADKPAPARPAAIAPILPPPPAAALPSPAALPAPALKPAALPPSDPPAPAMPSEAAAKPAPDPAAKPEPSPAQQSAASPLPPIEKIIDVPPPRAAAGLADPDGPIPLLPSAAAMKAPETEKAAAPVRPGPGSGGLY